MWPRATPKDNKILDMQTCRNRQTLTFFGGDFYMWNLLNEKSLRILILLFLATPKEEYIKEKNKRYNGKMLLQKWKRNFCKKKKFCKRFCKIDTRHLRSKIFKVKIALPDSQWFQKDWVEDFYCSGEMNKEEYIKEYLTVWFH